MNDTEVTVAVLIVGVPVLGWLGYRFVKWLTTPARKDDELG